MISRCQSARSDSPVHQVIGWTRTVTGARAPRLACGSAVSLSYSPLPAETPVTCARCAARDSS